MEVNLRPVFDDPALKFEVGISIYFLSVPMESK